MTSPPPPLPQIITVTRKPQPSAVVHPKLPDTTVFNCGGCFYCFPRDPNGEVTDYLARNRFKKYKEGVTTKDEFVTFECKIHWCNEEAVKKKAEEEAKKAGEESDGFWESGDDDVIEDFVVERNGVRMKVLEVLKIKKNSKTKDKGQKNKAASKKPTSDSSKSKSTDSKSSSSKEKKDDGRKKKRVKTIVLNNNFALEYLLRF